MERTIYFYDICYKIREQINMSTIIKDNNNVYNETSFIEDILNAAETLLKNNGLYTVYDNKFIEFKNIDEHKLFGIIGKEEKLESGFQRRITDDQGNTVSNPNYTIEDFRYFFVDLNTLQCSVLSSNKAPDFKKVFETFIRVCTGFNLEYIRIVPKIDTNINNKIKNAKKISSLSMNFTGASELTSRFIQSALTNLQISNNNLINVKLDLTMKNQPVSNPMKELAENFNFNSNKEKKIKYYLEDKNEHAEIVELIEKILTKQINIEISNTKEVNNYDLNIIKKALEEALYNN